MAKNELIGILNQLKADYKVVSTLLREVDLEIYQNTPNNKCYDGRHVNNMLSDLYNAIADIQNYVNVNELNRVEVEQ